MKHRFSLWRDAIYPTLAKMVGKRYGCCNRLKNCIKCIGRNGVLDTEKFDKALTEYWEEKYGRRDQ